MILKGLLSGGLCDEPDSDWGTSRDRGHDDLANKNSNAMLVFVLFPTVLCAVIFPVVRTPPIEHESTTKRKQTVFMQSQWNKGHINRSLAPAYDIYHRECKLYKVDQIH